MSPETDDRLKKSCRSIAGLDLDVLHCRNKHSMWAGERTKIRILRPRNEKNFWGGGTASILVPLALDVAPSKRKSWIRPCTIVPRATE